MNQNAKLRWGAFALIASALMTVVGLYLRGPLVIETTDARAFAESVASPNNLIAETFLPLSLIIQLFGFLGIYAYLNKPDTEKSSFWGMVFSILGNGLFIPFAGAFAFAIPVVGKLYLEGNTEVIAVAEQTLGPGVAFAYLIASAFALTVGAVLFAVAMRKNGLPLWLPIIYVVQAFVLSFGASIAYAFEVAGGVLLLVFSIVFGMRMWNTSSN
ncbi:MAG TPA: hypothetical protein VK851_10055 [Anaerolineales bacterium]|nr:hypothetical protein [Anaerolineales bacterium]